MDRPNAIVKISSDDFEKFFNFKNIKITRVAYEIESDSILLGIYTNKLPSQEGNLPIIVGNFEVHQDDYENTKITKLLVGNLAIDV